MRILAQKQHHRPPVPGAGLIRGAPPTLAPPEQAQNHVARLWTSPSCLQRRDFSSLPVHGSPALPLQTKLTINQSGDAFEQEADRLSQYVMRREAQLSDAGGALRTRRFHRGDAGPTDVVPVVHEALQSSSRAIDSTTHSAMASRFGHDFSHVRVHTDPIAAHSASALNARAYTVGHHIVFGAGEWAPATNAGGTLLAHELVHVLQQQRSAPGVQRQSVGGASSKDQEDFVRQTIRFLDDSAEHYRLVAKVNKTLFDRVIDSWYSMVVRQEALIDKDLHGDKSLKAGLHSAYISALRVLISKHASTSKQTEEDLYRINSGRIPSWALPHPSHHVAGMTTEIPDDVTVTTRRGRVHFNLNGFDVTVSPDIRVRSQRTTGLTTYHIGWGGVRGRFRRTRAGTSLVSMTGPPTPVVTLLTSYIRGENTGQTSGYGRGTTSQDQAGAKVTPASGSVAFHESRHSQAVLDFLRSNPPPTFAGKIGDTVAQFDAAMNQWKAAAVAYSARLEKVDSAQVHCVGFTVDEFNTKHPQRGRQTAKECP